MDLIGACEQQVTLTAAAYGMTLQSRPDYVMLGSPLGQGAISIDLKTTKNLNDLNSTGIVKLGYHTQAALVRRMLVANGHPDVDCYLLAVEKCAPYRSALLKLKPELLAAGDQWIDTYAPRLAHCLETGQFPRAVPGIVEVDVPRWLRDDAAA
jgi:hypothetical protein